MSEILNIKNLSLDFKIQNQLYPAISNVDMSVKSKEIIGIVGESGSGKSLTAKTIMGIAPNNAHIDYEILNYKGKDINQTLKKNRK
ncbi:ATP-binding cassette domain-containing protein, partial [Alloiococcus otitis]